MPVVNVNLSMEACQVYTELTKLRRASRIVDRLLIEYWNLGEDERGDVRNWTPLMVEYGDIRKMSDGQYCAFTPTGWVPCDYASVCRSMAEPETEGEKWIREQKELHE